MERSVSHKGSWCWLERRIFCQEEDGCLNCEIYVRYGDTSDNNGVSSGDTCLHSVSNEKKQQKELSGRQKCQP